MLRISVSSINGKALDPITADRQSTVFQLKEHIARQTGIPVVFQTLLHEATTLDDITLQLADHFGDNICVTLLVTMESLSEHEKSDGLESVRHLLNDECSPKKASIGIAALSRCAQDETSRMVRMQAVEVLAQVAGKGDESVIALALMCLEDRVSTPVRKAAVKVLAKVVHKGDSGVVAAVLNLLHHEDEMLRSSALAALAAVAAGTDKESLGFVLHLLQDPSWSVRCAVAKCLQQLAMKGDDMVLAALSACQDDTDSDVRQAAALAVEALSL